MKNKLSWMPTALARVALLAASALLAALPVDIRAAAFTAGNIVVYRAGSGTGNEVNTGNPVFLDEYTPSGTLVQSIALPTTSSGTGTSPNALVCSGTATSEGMLTRSSDGRYLILTGYKATPPYSASLTTTASGTVPRVIGRVDSQGNVDTTTTVTDNLTGNNPRSACSVDGTAFWCAGGAASPCYVTLGASTSVQISTTVVNNRQINIFGGQLYTSDSSGSAVRLGAIGTGLPTTASQTIVNLPGFETSGSPYAFFFCTLNGGANFDTVYVADDTATTGGIQKWCLVSGSWTLKGTITGAASVRGLTATVSGTTVTLYGTTGGSTATGGGSIYSVVDSAGYNAAPTTTTVTTIATPAANTAFRGIAFAPVNPVPGTLSMATTKNTPASLDANKLILVANAVPNGVTLKVTAVASPGTAGGSVSLSGTTITYTPPTSTFTGSDSFTYTLSDGLGGSATGTVNVTVNASNVGPTLTALDNGSGYGTFTASGIPSTSYTVQISTDTTTWTDYATVAAALNGLISYTDSVSIADHGGTVFYRLKQ